MVYGFRILNQFEYILTRSLFYLKTLCHQLRALIVCDKTILLRRSAQWVPDPLTSCLYLNQSSQLAIIAKVDNNALWFLILNLESIFLFFSYEHYCLLGCLQFMQTSKCEHGTVIILQIYRKQNQFDSRSSSQWKVSGIWNMRLATVQEQTSMKKTSWHGGTFLYRIWQTFTRST